MVRPEPHGLRRCERFLHQREADHEQDYPNGEGKNHFHVCAMDRTGRAKQFTRRGLEKFIGAHEPCVVGMEACGGAHHWRRRLRALGYDARLMNIRRRT